MRSNLHNAKESCHNCTTCRAWAIHFRPSFECICIAEAPLTLVYNVILLALVFNLNCYCFSPPVLNIIQKNIGPPQSKWVHLKSKHLRKLLRSPPLQIIHYFVLYIYRIENDQFPQFRFSERDSDPNPIRLLFQLKPGTIYLKTFCHHWCIMESTANNGWTSMCDSGLGILVSDPSEAILWKI